MAINYDYEVVVIGSGFGGAITACRTAKRWPGKIMVLERGKRYPMGAFPRTPHDMARNFWNLPVELRRRPQQASAEEMHGLFDIRNYNNIDAVICAGLGGGSLIYANVYLEPPKKVFDYGWPASCTKMKLQPYYKVAKCVLGARPIPQNNDPRREIVRTKLFQKFAVSQGRKSRLLDINVFFGNNFHKPLPIGEQQINRYGALQTSCVYCAECDVGCNTHSKNTLDLNYLFVAEHRYDATIVTEHLAEKIIPLNESGEEDAGADGTHGYHVIYQDLNTKQEHTASTKRVVVAAGTLGSTELLLRCRDVLKSLPKISQNLGRHFSGNGDFLSFVVDGKHPANPNYGPVITQAIDFNLFKNFNRDRAFLLEDASYPAFLAWFMEGARPPVCRVRSLIRTIWNVVKRWIKGRRTGRVGYIFSNVLRGDLSHTSSVLLCMGIDRANGTMTLDEHGYLDIEWPTKDSMSLYNAILDVGRRFSAWAQGKAFIPLPNWWWPFRNNVTVHALGGCILADNAASGVTSADPKTLGQVFGYTGLYVADGAIVPTAVGANPSATISALAERVAEGITGIAPDCKL